MNPLSKPKNKLPVFCIGDVVRHRLYPFRGVIVDVDPEFDNTEEWYAAIPEDIRPERVIAQHGTPERVDADAMSQSLQRR